MHRKEAGYTLLELIIVGVSITILVTLLVLLFIKSKPPKCSNIYVFERFFIIMLVLV